jgi:hypothetical protein
MQYGKNTLKYSPKCVVRFYKMVALFIASNCKEVGNYITCKSGIMRSVGKN